MDSSSITRAGIEVHGFHREHSDLVAVIIRLSDTPPADGVQVLDHQPRVSSSLSMHPPKLHGSTVEIRPPDSELKRYVAQAMSSGGAYGRVLDPLPAVPLCAHPSSTRSGCAVPLGG